MTVLDVMLVGTQAVALAARITDMPALGGRQPIGFQYIDYSGERDTVTVYANEITAISLPGLLTDIAALETALNAVTLGNLAKTSFGNEEFLTNTKPTDKMAQVETQMLVRCMDSVTEQPFSFRLPTADYTKFNYATDSDQVILAGAGASAETLALVTALQAFSSPFNEANSLTVVGMEVVR